MKNSTQKIEQRTCGRDIGYPYLHGLQKGLAVQQLRFADGSVVSTDTLLKQTGLAQDGTAGADTLQGSDSRDYGDVLSGGAANDVWFDDERRVACLS